MFFPRCYFGNMCLKAGFRMIKKQFGAAEAMARLRSG